jgi:EmrB/QacA subfamily drug resistance transporter
VSTSAAAPPALSESQKRLILIAAILGSSVVFIDSTVVNVALPAIGDDLGGGLAGQQWTSNAYLVTLSALILIGGSLGDIFGERRIFTIGVLGFGVTSLMCMAAPTVEVLVLSRALQGVFGALLTPAALALIIAAFPPDERGKAVGAWTAWAAIATVLGPLIGGQLVDAASWRWIFAINLPLVAVDIWLIRQAMLPPLRTRAERARVDYVGSLLCAAGLAGVTFGLIRQPEAGWADATVAVPLVGGALLFAAFLVYEARSSHPMLPLTLFRSHNFAIGNIETLAMYAGLSLLFFFLVLFLQQVAGYSAIAAGAASLPVTGLMFVLSRRFGALADRYGPRLFMTIGPLVMAAGLALFLRLDADVDYASDLLPALVLFGLGLSMTVAPLTAAVLAGADEQNAGIASGVNNAISRVAGLVAVAAVGAVVAASFSSTLDKGIGTSSNPAVGAAVDAAKRRPLSRIDPPARLPAALRDRLASASEDASVRAFHVGMAISAGLVGLGGLLGLGIRNPKREVKCSECAGGQLVGVPQDTARADEREVAVAA